MARPRKNGGSSEKADAVLTADYRHTGAKRKNVPPASMAAEGVVPKVAKARYAYSPHLPPVLRFDPTGKADALPALLAEAGRRPLKPDELKTLAEALRRQEPWLEWAGKRESDSTAHGRGALTVDPVALHIHERVSAQAVLRVAARQDVPRDLFADPEQEYQDAVQFYKHDVDWANRLILGDSLQVMSSLARREGLAGKVQMIYIDPPYGIKFASNFQPEVGRRDVKDKEEDLTREPEMVKAYRDTWNLGVHSYLAYLRDRLILARELLADTGSVFVQISDENLHSVRALLDSVFEATNFCGLITLTKAASQSSELLPSVNDYLIWYARHKPALKYHQLFKERPPIDNPTHRYICVETPEGVIIDLSLKQKTGEEPMPAGEFVRLVTVTSQTGSPASTFPYTFEGKTWTTPGARGWSTNQTGLERL